MLELIAHRGPDDAGVEVFDGVAFAANRLAIQDLSEAGRMPMTDPSGRYTLIFNGEIYNFVELRADLERAGETFTSHGDTEVLLRLLAREGRACLPKLDGMFAFVLFDHVERRLLVVRDRFGIKPLYTWFASDGVLYLASEIKAFTASPRWAPTLNGVRARDYLARGLIDHTDETMFEGVRQVPAGHWIEIDARRPGAPLAPRSWYAIEPEEPAPGTGMRDWSERCGELLLAAVRRRLRADVTVGSCLSGGLDSSSIVCLVAEARREAGEDCGQKTITARPPEARLDEWSFAQQAAEMAGAEAIDVSLDGGAFFDAIDDLVWTHDEPFATPSIFAQHKVFEAARAHGLTVMLDGQGADEQFAGYHAFFKVRLLELLRRGRVGQAIGFVRGQRREHAQPAHVQLARALASGVSGRVLGMLARPGPIDAMLDLDALSSGWTDPFFAMTGRGRGVREFSRDQITAGSLPMLLHWEDRNAMAHGVEARVPFLSPELVAFVHGLPSSAKIDNGVTKVVLREAMKGRVPEAIRIRTDKLAFETPDRRWLCGQHCNATRERAAAAIDALAGFARPGAAAVVDDMLAGRRHYDRALWRVICFGTWLAQFGVRSAG